MYVIFLKVQKLTFFVLKLTFNVLKVDLNLYLDVLVQNILYIIINRDININVSTS